MVDKAKQMIPDFIKDGLKNVRKPLGRVENAIETARDRVVKNVERLDRAEVKRVFDDLGVKIRKARGEVENFFADGATKTLSALNVPTRDEVDVIKADLVKLSRDLRSVQASITGKKPAKKVAKKGRK
jgi:polyhydroxyalkanoate synthesis regulator phasin